jgi:F0F1-type ATP synthase delta subunit
LSKYLGREIDLSEVEFVLDPKIIAGIRIEVDSEIIDLTLNNRLEKIIEVLNNNA